MSTPVFRKHLFILVAVLTGTLCAQVAHALDVKVSMVTVSDAATGLTTKLVVGRKLAITCRYEYSGPSKPLPVWQIQLQVDGNTIGTYTAEPPPKAPFYNPVTKSYVIVDKPQPVKAFLTPKTVGEHQAKCVLDPGGKLEGLDSNSANNTGSTSFAVDVAPVVSFKQPPGPSTANPSGPGVPAAKGFVPGGTGTLAQGSTPLMTDPELVLGLKAQPLSNCGMNQDVIAIIGTLNNVGTGFAVIPPGKQVIQIEAAVGVHGAGISTGNIAPGQSVPVNVSLKPKGAPSSLAGATLKLNAYVTAGIKQSSTWKNQQILTVVFPANFCKSPTATTGTQRPVAAPAGRAAPK